jgi:hypothetical protein
MAQRIVLGSLASAVVLFFWGFFWHGILSVGEGTMKKLANEEQTLAKLRDGVPEPGMYSFPEMDENADEAAQKVWDEKYQRGPSGLIVIAPTGEPAMTARELIAQFVVNLASSLIAAFLLSRALAGLNSFAHKVVFVALLGLYASLATNAPYWIWYRFPTAFTVSELADKVIGACLAGIVLSLIVKSPSSHGQSLAAGASA